jgi:tRNA(Ile)-lysidine synthase
LRKHFQLDDPLPVSHSAVFSIAALTRILTQQLGITPNTSIAIAYSGGLDSHVLLHAIAQVNAALIGSVRALHINHGLNPEAGRWMEHCQRVCADLRIPFVGERVLVPDIRERGLEAAARQARYACLARLIQPSEMVLTAHHLDDQSETMLLALLRAGGVHGLAAMPASMSFSRGRLVRPFLGFSRHSLATYAQAKQLHWIEDETNQDLGRTRNFLRHRILPELARHWPQVPDQLARSARYAAQAASLLDELAAADFKLCRANKSTMLRISSLRKLPPERQRNLLRFWIRAEDMTPPPETRLQQVLRHIQSKPRTRHMSVRWPGGEFLRYRETLTLALPRPAVDYDSTWQTIWDPRMPLSVPGTGCRLRAVATIGAGLSQPRIEGKSLSVRRRQGGEVCRLPGRRHRSKLKKLLQSAGIAPWERDCLPLVYADNELAAVGDRWVCEPFCARAGEHALMLVWEPSTLHF